MLKPFLIILLSIAFHSAKANIDSLKNIIQTKSDTTASLAYYELGKKYVSIDLDSSIQYFRAGANMADQLDFTNGKIFNYRALGSVCVRNGLYDESLRWLNKGLKLIDSLKLDIGNKVDFLINLGVAHYRVGFMGKAIEPYIEAVEICRSQGMDGRISMLLNNLGIFYRNLEQYEDAIKIYDQSLNFRKGKNDSLGMANVYFNKAACYSFLDKQREAILNLDSAEQLYKTLDQTEDLIHSRIARGSAYHEMDNFDQAYKEFKEIISRKDLKIESPFNFDLYQGFASCLINSKKYSEALYYLEKIEKELLETDLNQQLIRQYTLKSQAYEGLGQYKAAYSALDILRNKEKKVNEKDQIEFRQEMETKFLTKEKENEISLLNVENKLTSLKLENAKSRNLLYGIGLFIFASLLLWLYKLYQKSKHQNLIISQSNKEKEMLLKEIHHRVKNNLQVVSSLLNLQSKYIEDSSALSAINTGKARVQTMSLLHRNLYQNHDLKSINVKSYLEELCEILYSTYSAPDKNIKIHADIVDMEMDVDAVMPLGLITNELVSNALKHAFQNKSDGQINIKLSKDSDAMTLEVSDNGSGIPFNKIPEENQSMGMQLIKSFSKKLKAELKIDNTNGTKFILKIPRSKNIDHLAETG